MHILSCSELSFLFMLLCNRIPFRILFALFILLSIEYFFFSLDRDLKENVKESRDPPTLLLLEFSPSFPPDFISPSPTRTRLYSA